MANFYRDNYYGRSNVYNASSSAYAYDYIEEEEEKLTRKRTVQKEAQKVKVDKNNRVMHRIKFAVAILAVFAGSVAMMASHATVLQQRVSNKNLNSQLISLQNENVALEAEISDKVDLSYVQAEAISRLGMTEPQAYQIKYIDVPKQSYTIQYDVEEEEEKGGFSIGTIISLFKN